MYFPFRKLTAYITVPRACDICQMSPTGGQKCNFIFLFYFVCFFHGFRFQYIFGTTFCVTAIGYFKFIPHFSCVDRHMHKRLVAGIRHL